MNDCWLLRICSTWLSSGKIQVTWEGNSKVTAAVTDGDTLTNPFIFSLYMSRDQDPWSLKYIILYITVHRTLEEGHFLGEWTRDVLQKVPVTLRRKAWSPGQQHGLHELDIPPLCLVASERALSLLNVLLASPPPSPHCLGNRGPLMHDRELAYPVWSLDVLRAIGEAGKGDLTGSPQGPPAIPPGQEQFRCMSPFGRVNRCLLKGLWGSSATSSALPGVSWSSLVINMTGFFPSCWQLAMAEAQHPDFAVVAQALLLIPESKAKKANSSSLLHIRGTKKHEHM